MKKILSAIIAVTMLLTLTLTASALEAGEEHPYVTDDARVLSQSTVDAVNEANTRLYDEYGTYLVVVLIDYFGETDPDEYTVGLFNSWGISDEAALLVASVKEKKGGITLGSAIESGSNERDMGEMLDKYFWPDFDDGNYDRAVTRLMGAMEDWLTAQFGGQASGSSDSSGWLAGLGIFGAILGFIFRNIFIILLFVLIIVLIVRADRRRYRGYYTGVGLPIPRYYPWYIFVRSHPYHRYRPPTPPRQSGPVNFGGFSGPRSSGPRPSSTHRTSSTRPSAPRPSHPSGSSFRGGGGRSGGGFSGRR